MNEYGHDGVCESRRLFSIASSVDIKLAMRALSAALLSLLLFIGIRVDVYAFR